MIKNIISKWQELRPIIMQKMRIFRRWHEDHAMQRKLIITGTLAGLMIVLLIGTRFTPQKSDIPNSELNNAEDIGDDVSVSMTSKQYNQKKRYMLLKFKVATSSNTAIDLNKIKFTATTVGKAGKPKYRVLPFADMPDASDPDGTDSMQGSNNIFVVILTNLKPGFRAVQVQVDNKLPEIDSDTEGFDSTDDQSDSSTDTGNGSDSKATEFTLNEDDNIVHNKMPNYSKKEIMIQTLNDSIKETRHQIQIQKDNIRSYQDQARADTVSISSNQQAAKYQTDDSVQKDAIANAQADIKDQHNNVEAANKKIIKLNNQLTLYQQNIEDVKNGTYKLAKAESLTAVKVKDESKQ